MVTTGHLECTTNDWEVMPVMMRVTVGNKEKNTRLLEGPKLGLLLVPACLTSLRKPLKLSDSNFFLEK